MKLLWLFFLLPSLLLARPKGSEVISGTAEVQHRGSRTSILTSDRAIINWDEFSIHAGEKTQFIQPNSHSAILNRVKGGISYIDGFLEANGRVYLVNPRGVVVGKEGIVKTAGFVASTLDLENEDFFKNHALLFKGKAEGSVVNLGTIEALGGDVILLARAVVNEGSLKAKEGLVGIAASEEILLKPSGDQRLFIAPAKEGEKDDGGIENRGFIEAARAELRADGNVFRFAINQSGIIEASGAKEQEGRVYLVADGGSVIHSGKIKAVNEDKTGGTVHLLGDHAGLLEGATIDVSGQYGGGELLIGGDFQGKNRLIRNATTSVVMPGAEIHADAIEKGDGGKIIVWSDEVAIMQGSAYARGGKKGGDGGLVEVSGLDCLQMTGYVDTSAPKGKVGDLFLDPSNIEIVTGATTNVVFTAATGTFSATNAIGSLSNIGPAMPNLTDTLTSSSTNIIVTSASAFGNPGNILVTDGVIWANDNNLTLRADGDIIINAGSGGLVNTGAGSVFLESATQNILLLDSISMAQGSVSITSVFGTITFQPSVNPISVTSVTGNVALNAGFAINLASGVPALNDLAVGPVTGSLTVNCGGNVSIQGPNTDGTSTILSLGESPNLINVGGNLELTGGSITNSTAILGGMGTTIGKTTLNVDGDLVVRGGSGAGSPAILGVTGTSSSTMNFNVGGDVRVLGGNTDSYAVIGSARGILAGAVSTGGRILFDVIGGGVEVRGGGTNAFAHIGFVNGQTVESGFQATGDVLINNIQGDVLIQSSIGPAAIGFGNPITLGDDHYMGSVGVDARLDVDINATGNTPTAIGFILGGALDSTVQSNSVEVSGRNINVNAANGGDAYIGLHVSDAMVPVQGSIGIVRVIARDDIQLNPSSTSGFDFDGSGAIGTFAENGQAQSNIFVQGQNVFLNTFSGIDGAKARIITSDPSLAGAHQINIEAENLFVTTAGEVISAGNLEAISNATTFLSSGSIVQSNGGMVTLVVDNAFSEEPEIGDGQFVLQGGALLTSNGGPLRIFTARRSQNTINAPINGATFVPGPLLTDSATEQWGAYFPNLFGGVPFTIFYKTGLPSDIFNSNGRVISEMFQNLKTYDELLFSCKYFLLGYDKACYDQQVHPKGMVSSFDLFHDEFIEMLRQKYRNYHLKYVESF